MIFVLLVFISGKIRLAFQFDKDVKTLFKISKNITRQTFNKQQLDNLPEPVRRYFNYTLNNGQPYINYARIKHDGQFKTGIHKSWINIKGEQYATMEKPGFIWKGTTVMFIAQDMYIADKGKLVVSLLSLFNIVYAEGEHYNQGELLRWLGESILYPTNFLPSERLKWYPIDPKTAKLTFNYNGFSLFFKITFNETGEITQMETKRYMDENSIKTWIIKVENYKEINNMMVPTGFEVLWRLEKGDFSYAKFNVSEIEYEKPQKF